MGQNHIWLDNPFVAFLLKASNLQNEEDALRLDNERRLMIHSYSLLVGHNAAGAETEVFVEDEGQLGVSLYGGGPTDIEQVAVQDLGGGAGTPHGLINTPLLWDGANFVNPGAETQARGAAQRMMFQGQDEATNPDAVRTDPNRILWLRNYLGYVQVPSAEVPAPEGDVWNPGAAGTVLYEFCFLVTNNDAGGAAVTVSVGIDVGAVGALAAPEYVMFEEVVPYPGTSGWRGPFVMNGDDAVRAEASVANDASIHFKVRRVDVGA